MQTRTPLTSGLLCGCWLFLCASAPLSADEPPSSSGPTQAANGALPTPAPTLAEVRYGDETVDTEQSVRHTRVRHHRRSRQKNSAFEQFLHDREQVLPWIEEYSPSALVTADDPPVGLFYSAKPAVGQVQKDPTHTANFGVKLQQRCEEAGVAYDLIYPGAPNTKYKSPTEYLIHQLRTKSPSSKPIP